MYCHKIAILILIIFFFTSAYALPNATLVFAEDYERGTLENNPYHAWWIGPPAGNAHHTITTEKKVNGNYALKAWLDPAAPSSESHRAYPCLGMSVDTPVVVTWWTWLDYSPYYWFSTVTFDDNPDWSSVMTPANIDDTSGRLKPIHVNSYEYINNTPFPKQEWVRITTYLDFENGYAHTWQNGEEISKAWFSSDYSRVYNWHWGLYAGKNVSYVLLYEDDIQVWQLDAPMTEFSQEPLFGETSGECDIYVDNCSSGGTGTQADPYCTLAQATNAAIAGDTVCIMAGTYEEPLVPKASGTAADPITYKAFGDGDAILTKPPGTDAPSGASVNGITYGGEPWRCLYLLNVDNIVVDGLKFQNCFRMFWGEQANHNTIRNCEFDTATSSGGSTSGLYFFDSQYNTVENNYINKPGTSGGDSLVLKKSNYNKIIGNTWGEAGHAIFSIRCSSKNILRNNYFNNPKQKIGEIYDCEDIGVYDSTHYNLIENNVFAQTGTAIDSAPYHGIQLGGQDGIVRRNVFYNNVGGGIGFYLNTGEAKITTDNKVFHNVFYDNEFGAIRAPAERSGTTFGGHKLINNIFYKNFFTNHDWRSHVKWWPMIDGTRLQIMIETLEDYLFEKNIIFHNAIGDNEVIAHGNRDTGYYTEPTNPDKTVTWWQTNHSLLFTGNIEANPNFVNATAHDFNLNPGSPAIDAGVFLTTATNSGSNSTNLVVADAGYFFDGFGIDGELGDLIQLNGQTTTVRITSINYSTNTITLSNPLIWASGTGVSLAYNDSAPDLGAIEFLGTANTCSQGQHGICNCGGTIIPTTQICCSNTPTTPACVSNSDCGAGETCQNPDSCNAECAATTGCINMPALINYIAQWKSGNLEMPVLLEKILAWKTQAGC